MKKKLLLIGYRGYGDWLFTVPVLKYLFEEYDVHLETNVQGFELFHDDPRFIGKTVFDTQKLHSAIYNGLPLDEMSIVKERWEAVENEVNPDKVINLFRTFESKCLAEQYQEGFISTSEERRRVFGVHEVYKQIFDLCEIPFPHELDTTGVYYSDENISWAEKWSKKHEDDFVIMVAVSGSGFQKKYPYMKELVFDLLEKYDNSVIYLVGSDNDKNEWKHERIYHSFGDSPFKQSTLMVKYADLVIGPETGLHVAAGMWGTAKIQFCNMCSIEQICSHHKNDYSVQSKSPCSPCHKMVNNIFDCDKATIDNYKLVPHCITEYDMDEIMNNIETVYSKKGLHVVC